MAGDHLPARLHPRRAAIAEYLGIDLATASPDDLYLIDMYGVGGQQGADAQPGGRITDRIVEEREATETGPVVVGVHLVEPDAELLGTVVELDPLDLPAEDVARPLRDEAGVARGAELHRLRIEFGSKGVVDDDPVVRKLGCDLLAPG